MTELDAEALCQQLAAQMRPHVTPATAFDAHPGVAAAGNTGRLRQAGTQGNPPVGIAQASQHRLDEIFIAALQDSWRAVIGEVAGRGEDDFVLAHHMFPAPGV